MYLKRIIGLPGEKIAYRNGVLYINERVITDPFARITDNFEWSMIQKEAIPEGHYFVLGDNRLISKDSRSFGVISEKQIKGIVKEEKDRHAENPRKN